MVHHETHDGKRWKVVFIVVDMYTEASELGVRWVGGHGMVWQLLATIGS